MITKRQLRGVCFLAAVSVAAVHLRAEEGTPTPVAEAVPEAAGQGGGTIRLVQADEQSTAANEPAGSRLSLPAAASPTTSPPSISQRRAAPTAGMAAPLQAAPSPATRRPAVKFASAPASPTAPTVHAAPVNASAPEAVEPRETGTNNTASAGGSGNSSSCSNGGDCNDRRVGDHWRNVTKPRLQYRYWGYAPFFREPGLGANIYPMINAQVASGLAEQLVLYNYDFVDNGTGTTLNPHGQKQLCRMAHVLSHCDYVLVIERNDGNPALDEARRLAVIEAAKSLPVPLADDRVVVACPLATGLRGSEAEIINVNQLRQTANGFQQRSYSSAAAFSSAAGSGTGTGSGTP
ncbi:MAG: hypothetical protein K8T25_14825 [Planctomycetia bacterium]|nr:hypothetical protein [Planctomycetia bacterium]